VRQQREQISTCAVASGRMCASPPSPNAHLLTPLDVRDSHLTNGHHGSATINRRLPLRRCARVALVVMAVSASFGLAACGAIDDLRDGASRWFDVANPPGQPGGLYAVQLANTNPMTSPKKSLKNEASKALKTSKKKGKPASLGRSPRRPRTADQKLPTSHAVDAPKPQVTEPQSVQAQPAPLGLQPAPLGLRTFWPEAPPSGTFSR
jgi:hypothetical protein